MPVARVTSKGRITIPKELREELGIKPGTKVYFVRTSQGFVLKPATEDKLS
jgi:antitoxin PrlF